MTLRWIAWRLVRELVRDRRTFAFFFLVPILVMTLIYYAISEDEVARIGLVTRGVARLFEGDLARALEDEKDVVLVELGIPDIETDPVTLRRLIEARLLDGTAHGILYLDQALLVERFAGRRGTIHLYVEGSRPTLTGLVLSAMSGAMDDLAAALPVVIDPDCSARCANSVNVKPIELARHYTHGSEDYRLIDYFLPVFPPFFVFFFTFIIATITFQRERARGTLERLMIAPIAFGQVVLGYVAGFFLFSGAQAVIILAYILALIGYPITAAQVASIGAVTVLMLLIALILGLALSFLAHNEFQAVQFIPLVILPQIFLSDMIWDIAAFPAAFRWLSAVLPLTHANVIMRNVLLKNQHLWQSWPELLVLVGFFVAILLVLMWVARRPRVV